MVFVASGLNHKTASLAMREKMAQLSTPDNASLDRLLQLPFVHEAVILSTCNRTEIYCEIDSPEDLLSWLSEENNIPLDMLLPHIYQHQSYEAIQHLLRVASGLDSMMLGESQILGQLKQAFRIADEKGGLKRELRHIFPFVFSTSKHIRTQSGIGNKPISIASAAVRLIRQMFSDYKALNVFIIGSGETAALVAKYLYQEGVRNFSIASRTRENADKLALKWHANPLSITDIPTHLPKTDVVISATACPLPFIDKAMLEQSIGETRKTPLFFLDLAVPRDIALDVTELPYTHLYNIDDLHSAIEKGLDERRNAATHAETLIAPALEQYLREHRIRSAQQVICDYRENMQFLAETELQRATKKMLSGHSQQTVMHELSTKLVNKLTHATTVGLQHIAADGHADLLKLANYLLKIEMPKVKNEKIT
ncbi:MAG: glutamyl-tRNA reductase [Gammaproteobacteria bacterium]|nr:glutamyl-tRNA reductase [Gammaproteobacteria bacterium]